MPSNQPLESISGLIERVTYFNADNGFGVLRVKVKGHRDLVTVLGSLPSAAAGEWIQAKGTWVRDRRHGLQFKSIEIKTAPPNSKEGMRKYLGSGMIKGIGPVYADKMVAYFGDAVFEIIDHQSARLEEIEGIGPLRRKKIKEAWDEQKGVRDIMVFLHSHGVGTGRAVRIYKTYGDQSIEKVRDNPYLLSKDIRGIGFKTADQIAMNLGIAKDSEIRIDAALRHLLFEATGEGHCGLPLEELETRSMDLLDVPIDLVRKTLDTAIARGDLSFIALEEQRLVLLPFLLEAERNMAKRIAGLLSYEGGLPPIKTDKAIEWVEGKAGIQLADGQKEALRNSLKHKVSIITGGPGVGKTTLIRSLLLILAAKKQRCVLCAPTGRASRRLKESTGREAKTIHRLLEVNPHSGKFVRNEKHPLELDVLILDEASMVDVPLMDSLLAAIPDSTRLVMVGDKDQLPSVGPGSVLKDFIASGFIPVSVLTEIFRQDYRSRITINAHKINQGEFPEKGGPDTQSDFYIIEKDLPEDILSTLMEVVQTRIPKKFGLDAVRDVQVLCPMNRGSLGMREVNLGLQAKLNPRHGTDEGIDRFGWRFHVGDKVIQTENDYDKDVFNGDIGRVEAIHRDEGLVSVRFDDRMVEYEFGELDELSLAYAITIHKSQGSEFPAVVIPLSMQQYVLLQRNLLYTAVTRGRKLVVLIGQSKAIRRAIEQTGSLRRHSTLEFQLKQAFSASNLV